MPTRSLHTFDEYRQALDTGQSVDNGPAFTGDPEELRKLGLAWVARAQEILDRNDVTDPAELRGDDARRYRAATSEAERFTRALEDARRDGGGVRYDSIPVGADRLRSGGVTRDTVALSPEQRMSDWARAHGLIASDEAGVSLRGVIRGAVLGVWDEPTERAMLQTRSQSSLIGSDGGFLVPTSVSAQVLDLARAETRVIQAGARTVPMPTARFAIARLASDPAARWRTESQIVDESKGTFEILELVAKSLATLVKLPIELIQDGGPDVEGTIRAAIASAIALEVDRVGLLGDGDNGEPVGLLHTDGVSTDSLGTAISNWDFVIDRAGIVEDNNHTVSAAITSPRVGRQFGKLKDSTNQPLRRPERVSYPMLETTQVPTDLGAGDDESLMFLGEWQQLVVGIRDGFSIMPLRERYMDQGEVGLIAFTRADIGVARTGAFAIEDQIQ